MDKIEEDILRKIIKQSYSFREVITKMGYDYDNRTLSRNIERQIHRYKINISHFTNFRVKNRYKKEKLEKLIKKCDTLKEVLLELDLLVITTNYTNLKKHLNKHNIDFSKMNGKTKIKWEEDVLRKTIKGSYSYREVLRNMGLVDTGRNFDTLKKYIKKYNIKIKHFDDKVIKRQKYKTSEILIENSTYTHGNHIKKRLYDEGLKERKCELCGQDEEWQGKMISLILDHINGIHDDNRIENLQIVCPNCNATLETHCGKNIKSKIKTKTKYYCECGNEKSKNSKVCIKCSNKNKRKIQERPKYEKLKIEIKRIGYSATGRKYGVSDNTIRKWIKNYENISALSTVG